ncbi:hypothetical protein [Vibrio cyclitrophicus]|uniref:Uncharacterized protein n=1 Tax=Vibrio cyclitrophicus ZF270 TaxID=1136176 RepID=A0AAN0N7P6_9VIBR|nr:hypothetical protein [Vibrio cyclitrophicus]OEE04200.1 hypothetical protein OC7_10145 [Vibrio cyclitrophicus ZF270]UPR26404.1 hypothetical protein ITG08_06630 [Vibrio cyclitrophicus]
MKLFHPTSKTQDTSNTEVQTSINKVSTENNIILNTPELLEIAVFELAAQRKYKRLDNADWDNVAADAMEYLEMSGATNFTRKDCITALKKAIKKPRH